MKKDLNITRSRYFFLCAFPTASCYNDIEKILKKQKGCFYAYIKHNQDKIKGEHIHICLKFLNARTWDTIHNAFYGAHIEIAKKNFINCVQYLTHKNDKFKEQYDYNLIKTNDKEQLQEFYNSTIENELSVKSLCERIVSNGGYCDIFSASLHFGLDLSLNFERRINLFINKRNYGKGIKLKGNQLTNGTMAQNSILNFCDDAIVKDFIKTLKNKEKYEKYKHIVNSEILINEQMRKDLTK